MSRNRLRLSDMYKVNIVACTLSVVGTSNSYSVTVKMQIVMNVCLLNTVQISPSTFNIYESGGCQRMLEYK